MTTAAGSFASKVEAEAATVDVGRLIAVAFAAVFFALGWTLAKVVRAVGWVIAAIRVGWIEAGGPTGKSADRKRVGGG